MNESRKFHKGVRLKKKLGQHLLVDTHYLDEIIRLSEIGKMDNVFEIGAGTGNLTSRLLKTVRTVVSVEIDTRFEKELLSLKEQYPHNFEVIFGDILKFDLSRVLSATLSPWKVIANIPFYITSPILEMLLLSGRAFFSDIFLTVQKEIAHRICALPGSNDSSSLSLFSAYHAEPRILFHIPRSAFKPPPLVVSSLIHLKLRDTPPVSAPPQVLFAIIRKAFGQRRKGIKNSLKGLFPGFSEKALLEILDECGINPLKRPQDITLSEFSTLALLLARKEKH